MKKIVFFTLLLSSFLVMACEESIFGAGGPSDGAVSDGKGSVQTNSGLAASSGPIGIECDEPLPLGGITVYGYAPNFGGFGGIVGISFALSYTGGGGGYVGNSEDDVSCSNPDLSWANNAFKKYRTKYQQTHGDIEYIINHPTGTLWTIELPSGQTATYKIANPLGGVALNASFESCS